MLDARSDYASALREQPFEFLFSITHLAIIPGDVIALPTARRHQLPRRPAPGLRRPQYAGLGLAQRRNRTRDHLALDDRRH
ncbi:MAG: hypothetical protein QM775_35615 [Pirellulales bacterium]